MSIASPLSQLSELRKKLDLMGYHEPLPLEAVPLVASLFRDFLQLTENFNNVKSEHSQLLKLKKNFEDNVEPYKEENINLIKQNNELHQEIMNMRENFESVILDMKVKAKKVEDENVNLKFLNNQYLQTTRNLKNVAQEKSEAVALQEQNDEAVQTPGFPKSRLFCHQQCIELINILQPQSSESFYKKNKDQDGEPHPVNLLHLSASAISKLQNENAELMEAAEQAHKAARSLEEKMGLRDKEIERLTSQLNQGKPLRIICSETKERKKDDVIQNLQQQLESLYRQNEELEKIIIKYCGKEYLPEKGRPNMFFFDTMCGTEKEVLARQFEKTSAQDKHTQYEDTLSCAKHTQRISRLEKAIKLANLEKRKLAEKIPPMVAKEKQLQSEISRLKRKVPPHGVSPSQCSERLARLVQILEAQRDFFKEECETLKRLQGKHAKIGLTLGEKSSSDTKISEIVSEDHGTSQINRKKSFVKLVEEERDFYKEKYYKLLERNGNLKEELSKATAEKGIMVTDDTPQKLRKENFDLLQRIGELEHQNSQGTMVIDDTSQKLRKENFDLLQRIRELEHQNSHNKKEQAESEKQRTERENLEKAVAQLQDTVEEFQKKLEKSSKEKQMFMQKYQQAIIENSKLRNGRSAKVDPAIDEFMPNIYTEDDLQEKIKEIEQRHKLKEAALHQQIEKMQKTIDGLKTENEAAEDSLASYKAMVSSLEHQVETLNYQLSHAVDESGQHKAAAEQIRLIVGHEEQSIEQLQQILIQKDDELNVAENKIKTLESDVEELKDILKYRETEITDLKSLALSLEEEKKKLTEALNGKHIQLSSLQQQIYSKEMLASELKISSSALEADVEKVRSEIRLKDEEISSLKEQLLSKTKQVEEISYSVDILRKENSRLLEELSLLTKENQFVTGTLESKLQELEELRKKDVGYVAELSRIQEVLSIKKMHQLEVEKKHQPEVEKMHQLELDPFSANETSVSVLLSMFSMIEEVEGVKQEQQRSELIQQYKNLARENARLETENQQLQSEAETVQMEVQEKDAEVQNLHVRIQSLEREIEEYMSARETHRLEMTFLNSSVSGLEAELHQKQQEIERLQAELREATSLSAQIDASREHLQKMLADESATNAKLISEVEDLRDEVRAVRAQLSSERTSVLNMESLMSTHREKEFRSHLMNQELNAEIGLLRSRLKESTEKVEALSKELSMLKSKIAETEMEKERLKRDITDERYERERDHNALLRLQHLQQLYVSEPSAKPSALVHSKFTLPKFQPLVSQESVPVSSTSEKKVLSKTQSDVSSRIDRSSVAGSETSQAHLVQAAASEFVASEESRQMWSKEMAKLVSSSKTELSHKTRTMKQQEKEPLGRKSSSESS